MESASKKVRYELGRVFTERTMLIKSCGRDALCRAIAEHESYAVSMGQARVMRTRFCGQGSKSGIKHGLRGSYWDRKTGVRYGVSLSPLGSRNWCYPCWVSKRTTCDLDWHLFHSSAARCPT